MKNRITKLFEPFGKLHSLSKLSVRLGLALMIVFYIIAIIAKLYVPHAAAYFEVLAVYRGCLEAAPAFLAVGVTAGLLGDLVLRHRGNED